jgi:hypothetical protein
MVAMRGQSDRQELTPEYPRERRNAIRDAGLILLIPVVIGIVTVVWLWLDFLFSGIPID